MSRADDRRCVAIKLSYAPHNWTNPFKEFESVYWWQTSQILFAHSEAALACCGQWKTETNFVIFV